MIAADSYEPREFENLVNDEFFTAWKIDDQPEREPSFQEIRDKVLLAHQMLNARDRARDRADKLAQSLRELHGDIQKLRETDTGIETITIPPMALWSNAPVFSIQMMSRPRRVPTELPGLRFPSDELRSELFDRKEGDVAVAPNQPQDIYYVALVSKHQPASREDFARSRQLIEAQIQEEQAEKMALDWLLSLRKQASGEKR
jgi:peptidyl-prolyl cis-trans isomerase D